MIRRVIAHLRTSGIPVPLGDSVTSHILIACSGGVDSTALAVLIAKYGHKLTQRVGLLHINHGWRGEQSDADERFVRNLADRLGIACVIEKLDPSQIRAGRSWEEWGRAERKKLYQKHAGSQGVVLTGHQADELCETLLWRLFTGAAGTHGHGILPREGVEIRPLLTCYKDELTDFLHEEGVHWRDDPSNGDPRFMRAALRSQLTPILDRQFPRWKENLLKQVNTDMSSEKRSATQDWLAGCFGGAGIRTRRVHWQKLQHWLAQVESPESDQAARRSGVLDSMSLEGGWRAALEAVPGKAKPRIVLDQG